MQHFLTEYLFVILSAFTSFALPLILRFLWQRAAMMHDVRLRAIAVMLAQAAQQAIPDTSARYDWVASALAERFKYLTAPQIQQLIESAVHVIKTEANRATPVAVPTSPIVVIDHDPNDEESGPHGPQS